MKLDQTYWQDRYEHQQTGWDLGVISPPLKAYFEQLQNKDLHILIPGSGNSHEALFLYQNGFSNTVVLDIAVNALANLKKNAPLFPNKNLVHQNFFEHHDQYDLIIEQTFFCALDPALRSEYCKKMSQLLKPKGKIAGLLFDREFEHSGPPFGATKEDYQMLFASFFNFKTFAPCYNSITPRQDNELFFIFEKK